jgi:holin-like protein
MLTQLMVIMGFQLAGEALAAGSGVGLPGPLCGLLMLLAYLQLRGGASEQLAATGSWLIDHLGLLFVPAGVAIMTLGPLLVDDARAIAAALILSTCLAILVSGLVGGTAASSESARVLEEKR